MTPDHLLPSPVGRITARQAAERMAAGMKCRYCERADLKLTKLKRIAGHGCAKCVREVKLETRIKHRDRRQRATFGITQVEAEQIEQVQDGGCICAPWTGYDGSGARALSTDHDHKTGEVRGRLCKHCNDLLGRVRDDPTYFRLMIKYLENPPARQVVGRRIVPGHNDTVH